MLLTKKKLVHTKPNLITVGLYFFYTITIIGFMQMC